MELWYPLGDKPEAPPQMEYVDATKYGDAILCAKYTYWRHERSLVTTQPQLPLAYGIGIHAGIATFYRGGSTKDMCIHFDKEWEKHAKGFEDAKRNPKQALATLTAYADTYKNENWKVLGVEMPGLIPITPTFTWTMIIDLLVEQNGKIFPVDHKTTSAFNQSFWDSMNPNTQFTGYMNGIRAVSGYKVTMLMVNGILVSKGKPAFERQITTRHPLEIERWKEEVVTFWEHTIVTFRKLGIWPKSDKRCNMWYAQCPYHFLCTSVSEDYMTKDPSTELYVKEVWDPLQKIDEVKHHTV